LGFAWTRIAAAAGDAPAPRWRTPAVLATRVLPEFDLLIRTVDAQCRACTAATA
jgi:hypothetical protein